MNTNNLYSLAAQLRNAIDKAKEAGEFDKDFSFDRFPRGCCGDATCLLGQYLLENGIDSYYVCGNRYFDDPEEGTQSHAWLEVEGLIVDITGDQFSDRASYYNYNERAYVGKIDRFHELFEVENRDVRETVRIEQLGGFCYPRLAELYRKIKKYM